MAEPRLLSRLRQHVEYLEQSNDVVDVQEALSTLENVYLRNLVHSPNECKYRSINTNNVHFKERIGRLLGGMRLFIVLGFMHVRNILWYPDTIYKMNSSVLPEARGYIQSRLRIIETTLANEPHRPSLDHVCTSVRGVGHFESQGPRPTMEDETVAVDGFCGAQSHGFFAVYDGHGGRGTVNHVAIALHRNFASSISAQKAVPVAFREAYLRTDAQIRRRNILQSGSTAVTCFIRFENHENQGKDCKSEMEKSLVPMERITTPNAHLYGESKTQVSYPRRMRVLYCANAGDSRAVLSRAGRAIRLTLDHKPSLPSERERIEKCGGWLEGDPPRVMGMLAVSRALGDFSLKEKNIVSAEPHCVRMELHQDDDILLLACDGVWDVLSDQAALDIVRNCLARQSYSRHRKGHTNELLENAAKTLVNRALELESKDNVSVLLVAL